MNPPHAPRWIRIGASVAVVVVVLATVASPALAGAATTTSADRPQPSLTVRLQENGDARVTLTLAYTLDSDDERAAFRTLRNDSAARRDALDRFADRMAAVAADAENATGRAMGIADPTISLSTSEDGSTGIVELSVAWTGLAAREDGALVVTEPFRSGYAPERPLVVVAPDGYRFEAATPAPDESGTARAEWAAGADLSGFRVAFTEAAGSGGPVAVPGFGAGAALLALAAAGVAARRRGRSPRGR